MHRLPASLCVLGSVVPLLLAAGCSSVFTDHAALMENGILLVQSGQSDKALDQVCGKKDERCAGGDRRLYMLEAGRINQLGGDFASSRAWFERALEQFREDDRAALVEGHRLALGAASLVSNEKAIPYRPPTYERVFAHHYQALNYLQAGDVEGAGVEIRNAVRLQQEARAKHEEELEAYREKLREKGGDNSDDLQARIQVRMTEMASVSAKAPSSFQNPYTWCLSGWVYEAVGDPANAYLSYRKAWELWPDNPYLQRDMMRLARREAPDVYRSLKDRFPDAANEPVDASCAEVILVVEQGWIPRRKEFFFALPISGQLLSTAFPYYDKGLVPAQTCRVRWQGEAQGATSPLASPQALAYRALEEKMPVLIIRALARGASKYVVADAAGDSGGEWVRFVANIANLITEQADLRSWYTLPASVQLWRGRFTPGAGTLDISNEATGEHWTLDRAFRAGELVLVYLADTGGYDRLESFTLIEGSDPTDRSDPSEQPEPNPPLKALAEEAS